MHRFETRTVYLPGGSPIVVRAVSEDDAEVALAYLRNTHATTDQVLTQPDELPVTVPEEQEKIREHERSGGLLMFALAEGKVVGFLGIRPGNRRRTMHTADFGLTIREDWRGRGVGSAMIGAMLAWAAGHPTIEKVCLQVFSTNPRAHGLYRRFGFEEEGVQRGQGQLSPGRYADNIHMGLWVKPRRDGG